MDDIEIRLERARNYFAKRNNAEDAVEGDDFLLFESITLSQASSLMEKRHGTPLYFKDNKLFAIDSITPVQARAASEIVFQFRCSHGGAVGRLLTSGGGENVSVVNGRVRQPDGSLIPRHRVPNMACPTIIVEVAESQSLESVYHSATEYFHGNTSVQGVVVIKFWDQDTSLNRAMLYMYFDRNKTSVVGGYATPVKCISFGTANLHHVPKTFLLQSGVSLAQIQGKYENSQDPSCTRSNILLYEVALDASAVFLGTTVVVPALPGNSIVCDLYDIQQLVLRET